MCVFVCVCVCVYVCINKAGQKGDSSSDANIPDEDPFYAHVRATQEQVCPPPPKGYGVAERRHLQMRLILTNR